MRRNFRMLVLASATCLPALAQFSVISQPTSSYTGSTSLISLAGTDFASISSVTDGVQTIAFSQTMSLRTVPGSWATWGAPPNTESSTPRVLSTATSSLTLTLSKAATTFGFEVEPSSYGSFNVTATFMNGTTVLGTVARSVNGNSGALLSAAASGQPITSVVVSADAGAGGFAVAQLRYAIPGASVPTLNTTSLFSLGALLLAIGALLARRTARPAGIL